MTHNSRMIANLAVNRAFVMCWQSCKRYALVLMDADGNPTILDIDESKYFELKKSLSNAGNTNDTDAQNPLPIRVR